MLKLETVKTYVKPYYEVKDIMHDLSHIERVIDTVVNLVDQHKFQVDLFIIKVAAYFHGIVYTYEDAIRNWLEEQRIETSKIDKIIDTAWASQKKSNPTSLEGKILHDAHMIEGGKVYLVLKSFITGSVRGQTLKETIDYIEHHILENGQCFLKEAKEVYKIQQDFAKQFIIDLKNGLMMNK